ncbi:imelysin family protein [Deinococcus roseus]|uniref:Efem/EfeO family lipoprotein n=1 Tax=Deinococcus roseus TaxID=392414 RepID=A0ABQ2DE57_9DEIO|nr:imelysin family protein [Deinococcus roseus]GGJ53423.1 Efem/EfeO family lipoprotein [Deinococcus roseus]
MKHTLTTLLLLTGAASASDLQGIKTYLTTRTAQLTQDAQKLKQAAERYYNIVQNSKSDYQAVYSSHRSAVLGALAESKNAWKAASPRYETVEGIVAGVEMLSRYDVLLDAGVSGKEGGEDVAPYDLKLKSGKIIGKPGNVFGVLEGTLFGTDATYTRLKVDVNGNGKTDLGEVLPDAEVLLAAAEALLTFAKGLHQDAQKWNPSRADAFGALIGNVPTVGDFFESWKTSRFVARTGASKDFAVISRLSDIVDNISSWQAIYSGLQSDVKKKDAQRDARIVKGFTDLKGYVSGIFKQEQQGKRYTREAAEMLGQEAQNRATRIASEIRQAAAQLGVVIAE